ncbi:hypothetical protein BKA70DRAFT_1470954 [Coprinopsis sp. MPI-PUGE-AT-0042]|nr:hypothetical protein BKA70DRAFT_1470954 [Coprinopsis sp. MPI-PUGE-AT-0042]
MNERAAAEPIGGYSVGYGIAIFSTIVRLLHRKRRQQLWWDDVWAALVLLAALHLLTFDVVKWSLDFESFSIRAQSFFWWAAFCAQSTAIWSSRLSIQTTVVYFLPPGRNRTISKGAAAVLFVAYLGGMLSKLFWNGIPIPIIPKPPYSKIPTVINMALGIVSTMWLVAWPAFILMKMKLQRSVRRILMTAFGSAVLLLASELFHGVNLMIFASNLTKASAHTVLVLSVVLSNIIVIVAAIYQRLRPDIDQHRDTTTENSEQEDSHNAGEITATKTTQLTSLVDPLTEFHSSDLHWSDSPHTSGSEKEGDGIVPSRGSLSLTV